MTQCSLFPHSNYCIQRDISHKFGEDGIRTYVYLCICLSDLDRNALTNYCINKIFFNNIISLSRNRLSLALHNPFPFLLLIILPISLYYVFEANKRFLFLCDKSYRHTSCVMCHPYFDCYNQLSFLQVAFYFHFHIYTRGH